MGADPAVGSKPRVVLFLRTALFFRSEFIEFVP
jgi:hypothetical protein